MTAQLLFSNGAVCENALFRFISLGIIHSFIKLYFQNQGPLEKHKIQNSAITLKKSSSQVTDSEGKPRI